MKKLLPFFTLLFFIHTTVKSQDTIFKTDGSMLQAKILEVNTTEIKYKKFNFLDGPTYIENKSEIKSVKYSNGLSEQFAAQPVTPAPAVVPAPTIAPPVESDADYYSKGVAASPAKPFKLQERGSYYLYNDRRIGERKMHDVLMGTKDKELISLVQSSKDAHIIKFVGFAAIPLGISALVVLASHMDFYGHVNSGPLAASGLLFAGAIACPIVSGIYSKKRKMYNHQAVKLYNEKF